MFIESMRPNSTFISLKLTSFSWHRFETSIQIFNAYRRKGTVKEKWKWVKGEAWESQVLNDTYRT